ncbi:hypothetical protein CLE01_31580 [Cryobacterium levicorallinum]|nr:hypothetical protein CLE01_31580 [Cryobacterium levicorallinum]
MLQLGRERFGITSNGNEASLAVDNGIHCAGRICGHCGQARGAGFENDVWEALPMSGQAQQIH